MKKIYNYKDGKAYFDNDVKMPISDKEYDMLFMEDGCLCERGNKVYDYLNNLLAPNKFTEAKLTDILTYIREHDVEFLTKVYEEEDVEMDYLYVDGELMWLSDGYNEFSKGDEKWEKFLAEVKKIDKDVETIKNKTMKNIKFSELSSLEYNEVYSFVKNCVEESFNTCPDEWKDSYKDMTLNDYRDSLIEDVWSEEGDTLGEGFSVIAFNVLNDDEDALATMFEEVRDDVWNAYIDEICEESEDCEMLDKAGSDDDYVAYDCYDADNSEYDGFGGYGTIYNSVIEHGGTIKQFAKFYRFGIYDNKDKQTLEVYKI